MDHADQPPTYKPFAYEQTISYNNLDNQFMNLWNEWYDAASKEKGEARALAKTLLVFIEGTVGKELIQETQKRVKARGIHVAHLTNFHNQVISSIASLKIYINNPSMVPEAASEFLANMQSFMFLCRDSEAK